MLRVRTAMYTQPLNTDNRAGNVCINIFKTILRLQYSRGGNTYSQGKDKQSV
jgi:hypothetical protein